MLGEAAHYWGNVSGPTGSCAGSPDACTHVDGYVEVFCRVAASGRANKIGLPNTLQLAVLLDRHRYEFALPSPVAQILAGPATRVPAVLKWAAGKGPD